MVHQKLNHFTLIPTPIEFMIPVEHIGRSLKIFKLYSSWPPDHMERGEFFHSFFLSSSSLHDSPDGRQVNRGGWSAIDNEDPYLQGSLLNRSKVPDHREACCPPSQWYPLPSEELDKVSKMT